MADREFAGLAGLKERFAPLSSMTLLTRNSFGEQAGVKVMPAWVWLLQQQA